MAPPYQDSSPPSFPSDHEDHHYSHHLFFPITLQASSSSSSSLSIPGFPHDHTALDHGATFYNSTDSQQLQLKPQEGVIVPCNIGLCNTQITVGNEDQESGVRFRIWKQMDKSESSKENDSVLKWSSSSKVRLNSDQAATPTIDGGPNQTSSYKRSCNSLNDAVIRTCSDCSTTKTPLWRSGPRGPKSLCNACGIRQRKARRAMAEAAAGGAILPGGKPAVLKAKKVQHKGIKRAAVAGKCSDVANADEESRERKKIELEEISLRRLSESSAAYQRVFPQDEREAAILLMALSYGLLHG